MSEKFLYHFDELQKQDKDRVWLQIIAWDIITCMFYKFLCDFWKHGVSATCLLCRQLTSINCELRSIHVQITQPHGPHLHLKTDDAFIRERQTQKRALHQHKWRKSIFRCAVFKMRRKLELNEKQGQTRTSADKVGHRTLQCHKQERTHRAPAVWRASYM